MATTAIRVHLEVWATIPPGVTPLEFAGYVEGEIKAGIGLLHPEDPLFSLDRGSVSVNQVVHDKRNDDRPTRSVAHYIWP